MSGPRRPGRRVVRALAGVAGASLWLKLASMLALATVSTGAWSVGNVPEAERAARPLLIMNAMEPHKAHFNLGTTLAAGGDLAGAQGELRTALRLTTDEDDCPIRLNLALVLEARAAARVEQDDAAAAAELYAEAGAVVGGADRDCRKRSLAAVAKRLTGAQDSPPGTEQQPAAPEETGKPAEAPLPAEAKEGLEEIEARMTAGQGRQQSEDEPRGSTKSQVSRPW